ncbi:MAG: TIGR03621 family F420-dependent LLM class oxidoreductase [Candidatus Dormibacteria bacterium]
MRPFRFGYQVTCRDPLELRRQVQMAEDAGFDVLCSFDHLGEGFSALGSLGAAAGWTSRIRLCPLVLNNDFHHPALLAQELATLDQFSGGRLEVGIGAGHAFTEYAAVGIAFEPPVLRKARLAESVEILRRLLDGETVTYSGQHYQLDGVATLRPRQGHVRILVGVNGRVALAHAARHADTIGLTMFGRTLPDGQQHEVRWSPTHLDATVEWIRAQAGRRWGEMELQALVQAVVVTDDRQGAAEKLARDIPGLTVADAVTTPFLALGTVDQIAEHLLVCRARWGISYYVVRELAVFSKVIERLRQAGERS